MENIQLLIIAISLRCGRALHDCLQEEGAARGEQGQGQGAARGEQGQGAGESRGQPVESRGRGRGCPPGYGAQQGELVS